MVNNGTNFTTGRTTSHIKSLSTTLTNPKIYSDVNSDFVLRHAQEDTKRIVNKHSGSGKKYSETDIFSKCRTFENCVVLGDRVFPIIAFPFICRNNYSSTDTLNLYILTNTIFQSLHPVWIAR